jgi:hypothetical protein
MISSQSSFVGVTLTKHSVGSLMLTRGLFLVLLDFVHTPNCPSVRYWQRRNLLLQILRALTVEDLVVAILMLLHATAYLASFGFHERIEKSSTVGNDGDGDKSLPWSGLSAGCYIVRTKSKGDAVDH